MCKYTPAIKHGSMQQFMGIILFHHSQTCLIVALTVNYFLDYYSLSGGI